MLNELRTAQDRVVKKFFNKMQRAAMAISAHDEYLICARGTGKSEGLDARFIIRNIWEMPGSMGALISPSYIKAWANTLPAICHALGSWGYKIGTHYYIGKAPKSANFKMPKRQPLSDAWSNCLHFWNGTIMVVLSFTQAMSANSMSIDWMIGPEAKFLDYDKIKSEVNPANRGNRQYFGDCPHHHSVMYTTDMPTSKRGKWILDKENEMDSKHIQFIRNLYKELKMYERLPEQTTHTKRQIKLLRSDLDTARTYQIPKTQLQGKDREYTTFFGEYDIFDNLEVVGKDFVWQMYRDSPPLIWRTAFMNERIFRTANGYYPSLSDIHFYIPKDGGTFSKLQGNFAAVGKCGCLADGDLDYDQPLHIAFDANASICTAVIGQIDGNRMMTRKEFYVKTPSRLKDLCKLIIEYYAPFLKKEIIFYYDHTFVWTSANNPNSYADTIIHTFEALNWKIHSVYIGQQPPHDWRYENIDMALKGEPGLLFPQFNEYNTEHLRIAMDQTVTKVGKNTFEKDKSPEKLADTPDNPDEHKTHITDAWDTLFVGMNFYCPTLIGAGGGYYLGRA